MAGAIAAIAAAPAESTVAHSAVDQCGIAALNYAVSTRRSSTNGIPDASRWSMALDQNGPTESYSAAPSLGAHAIDAPTWTPETLPDLR
jgi:hypothetical protein